MTRLSIIGTRGYPSFYGGFETAVRHLAPYLQNDGWEVSVYGREKGPSVVHENGVCSINTLGIERKALSTLSYGLTSVLHAAFISRPKVALVMNVANGFWLPSLKMAGIRTLVNVDGIEWEREKWSSFGRHVFKLGAWFTAKFADELVFDADAIGERWRRDFKRDGTFIPYGSEEKSSNPIPLPSYAADPYVLYVARFVPENSILEFIAAIDQVDSELNIVIVGSSGYMGPIDESVRAAAESSPRVHWLGHVNDDQLLHSLWSNATVYFHGHTVGGTNPALVQAMALGAPTVARDTVYNREVLGELGQFTTDMPDDIASAINSLAADSNLQSTLPELLEERANTHYNWPEICNRYSSTLRDLIR